MKRNHERMSKVIVYGRNKSILKLDSLMTLQTVCLGIVANKFMLSRDNLSRQFHRFYLFQRTEWCKTWQLKFNPDKCETMRITHKQDKSKESNTVDPNGEILKSVKISYVVLQYRTIFHGAIIFTKSSIKLTKSLCH